MLADLEVRAARRARSWRWPRWPASGSAGRPDTIDQRSIGRAELLVVGDDRQQVDGSDRGGRARRPGEQQAHAGAGLVAHLRERGDVVEVDGAAEPPLLQDEGAVAAHEHVGGAHRSDEFRIGRGPVRAAPASSPSTTPAAEAGDERDAEPGRPTPAQLGSQACEHRRHSCSFPRSISSLVPGSVGARFGSSAPGQANRAPLRRGARHHMECSFVVHPDNARRSHQRGRIEDAVCEAARRPRGGRRRSGARPRPVVPRVARRTPPSARSRSGRRTSPGPRCCRSSTARRWPPRARRSRSCPTSGPPRPRSSSSSRAPSTATATTRARCSSSSAARPSNNSAKHPLGAGGRARARTDSW